MDKACYNCVHMTFICQKESGIPPTWDCSMSDTPWTGGIAELFPLDADKKMEETASKCNQYLTPNEYYGTKTS